MKLLIGLLGSENDRDVCRAIASVIWECSFVYPCVLPLAFSTETMLNCGVMGCFVHKDQDIRSIAVHYATRLISSDPLVYAYTCGLVRAPLIAEAF